MNYSKPTDFEEEIGTAVVHTTFTIHKELGPDFWKGFMRSVWNMNLKRQDLK